MSSTPIDIHKILPDNFISSVEEYLKLHPLGFKEYDLITYLSEKGVFKTYEDKKHPSLQMFQKHFLLFHVLYLISDKLIEEKAGNLKITPLLIQQYSYVEAKKNMGEYDPLREYYLDINNMKQATEETVADLLNSFWEQYLSNDKRREFLQVLNLADPVDDQEIKSTYRKLVHHHHPDKGGDDEQIKHINKAYSALIRS